MVTKLISCSLGVLFFFFLSYNIQFTLCSWESETVCEDEVPPIHTPLPQKEAQKGKTV